MHYIYVIFNKENGKYYIGQTNNLDRRIIEHNNPNHHYTGKISGVWELIYSEELKDRKSVIIRERQLKSFQGREFVKKYIPR